MELERMKVLTQTSTKTARWSETGYKICSYKFGVVAL